MPIIPDMDFQRWAYETCHDICNASDLKRICQARGFIAPKVKGKEALADFVEMRLLEPEGVHDALATLDAQALWALHTVRCARKPINAMELQYYFGFKNKAYVASAFKTRFKRIQEALINKGLLLARDTREQCESRFARMYVLLPPAVADALPQLPVDFEPAAPPPAFRDWAEAAMALLRADLLASREAAACSASPDWSSLFPTASIKNGILEMNKKERPALEYLRTAIFKNWLSIGSAKKQRAHHAGDTVARGFYGESDYMVDSIRTHYVKARGYILNAIEPGHGLRATQLFEAFDIFQCPMPEDARDAFLESGEHLGFLAFADADEDRLLVPNSYDPDIESAPVFANWRDADQGVAAPLSAVTLPELLTIARISTLVVEKGKLRARPSLKWIGRERESLCETAAIQNLLRCSAVYRQAFDTVAEREGKWVIHDNVSALKLGGSDIEAVLLAEYGPDSRNPRLAALGTGWYAVGRNHLDELLAFVKKKGFKPKIMPPSARKERTDTNKEMF